MLYQTIRNPKQIFWKVVYKYFFLTFPFWSNQYLTKKGYRNNIWRQRGVTSWIITFVQYQIPPCAIKNLVCWMFLMWGKWSLSLQSCLTFSVGIWWDWNSLHNLNRVNVLAYYLTVLCTTMNIFSGGEVWSLFYSWNLIIFGSLIHTPVVLPSTHSKHPTTTPTPTPTPTSANQCSSEWEGGNVVNILLVNYISSFFW